MKYYSELLNTKYDTAEECAAAEHEYNERMARVKAEKEAKESKRKADAKEVEEALNVATEAYNAYKAKLDEFVKNYGSYHQTIKGVSPMFDWLDWITRW